jgi:hypothetical protein
MRRGWNWKGRVEARVVEWEGENERRSSWRGRSRGGRVGGGETEGAESEG